MKTQNPKLKTAPRPLFSCGFFRHCTLTVLSPTTSSPPSTPPPLPPSSSSPPPTARPPQSSSPSSSSSSSTTTTTSQSFTQWRFPIPDSTLNRPPPPETTPPPPPPHSSLDLQELFHVAELHFRTGSDSDRVAALSLLERSLVPNPEPNAPPCPPAVMAGVIRHLKGGAAEAKSATKVLLALCLGEGNRRVAVEAGAAGAVVEAAPDLEGTAAERALAALELMCTVEEGAAEVKAHALAVPMMVEMMGKTAARGRECAISVLAVIFGGGGVGDEGEFHAPPEVVARAVALALREECSARARRKGAQLLKTLEENGRMDSAQDGR